MSLQMRRFVTLIQKGLSDLSQLLLELLSLRKGQSRVYTERAVLKRTLADRIPRRSWDSHMHVVDPVEYPLAEGALYTPKPHRLSQALRFEASTGIRNIVLVQPSIYRTDNSCLLDALRTLGPRHGRAVVAFDCDTIDALTLEKWHGWGVRGVRVNTQSIGKHMGEDELATTLRRHANIIRPYNWVLQLYVPLATAVVLERIVPELGLRVCLDHFGAPDLLDASHNGDPYNLSGFRSLVNLLRQGTTYVKLSAPYRISSDWPHTRFEGFDIKPYMEALLNWCGDEALVERVFKGNAEALRGIQP
ncbi:hypothetical protein BDW62DRAFT_199644 [Aspergillus aurantiobrunneus]